MPRGLCLPSRAIGPKMQPICGVWRDYGNETEKKNRKGEILPASVELIAAPPAGSVLVDSMEISDEVASKIASFEKEMLSETGSADVEAYSEAPDVDAKLNRKEMTKLLVRMVAAGMLTTVSACEDARECSLW